MPMLGLMPIPCTDMPSGLHEVQGIQIGPKASMASFTCYCGHKVENHALWHPVPEGWEEKSFRLACEMADLWYNRGEIEQ